MRPLLTGRRARIEARLGGRDRRAVELQRRVGVDHREVAEDPSNRRVLPGRGAGPGGAEDQLDRLPGQPHGLLLDEGQPVLAAFVEGREHRLTLIEQQAVRLAWEAVELIFRTAGTSASARQDAAIGRIFRNLAVINTHPALQLDRTAVTAARARFAPGPPAS